MPMLRGNALRSLQSSLRYSSARATARVAAPARTHLVAKRFASSGGHGGHGESSSDIPWLIGALVITPPSMWYLWPSAHDDHHDAHGHEEHAEEEKEEQEEEDQPNEEDKSSEKDEPSEGDQAAEDDAPKEEAAQQEQSDDSKKDEEDGKEGGEEEESEDDGSEEKTGSSDKGANARGVNFKGKMAKDSDGHNDTRKTEPRPSKGSNVRRIDSGLGKNLGEGPVRDAEDPKKETQATSKETSSDPGDITSKQKGLSTTDTRHSSQIDQDPEKSKKGSGQPETAKAKGTVDTKAPVR